MSKIDNKIHFFICKEIIDKKMFFFNKVPFSFEIPLFKKCSNITIIDPLNNGEISDKKFVLCITTNLNGIHIKAKEQDHRLEVFINFLKRYAKYINENKCLFFINTCVWPFLTHLQKKDVLFLRVVLNTAGIINFKNVILLTNTQKNANEKDFFFKQIFWEYFESALRYKDIKQINYKQKIENINNKDWRRFLYLNHKERAHRIYLFCKFFTEIKDFYTFFAASMCPGKSIFYDYEGKIDKWKFEINYIKHIQLFQNGTCPEWVLRPISVDHFLNEYSLLTGCKDGSISTPLAKWNVKTWRDHNIQWTQDKNLWEQVGIYIGVETVFMYNTKTKCDKILHDELFDHADYDHLSLTEKTFKPIQMKTPFIIYGQPFILKKLKEYGYKTFDNFWDESYDEILDPALRADKIVEVVEGLTKLTDQEFKNMLLQMHDIVEHNYAVFINRFPEQEIYNQILSFYEN